jgi:hypothetical protein
MRRTASIVLSAAVMVFAVSLLATTLVGCGGGDGGAERTGRLQVAITDQTGTYATVILSIRELRLVQLGQGDGETQAGLPVVPIPNPPHVVDVMQLTYQHELLGAATVPAGRYQQVRLVLDPNEPGQPPANYLTLAADPDTPIPIDTPSGQTSGLKVLGRFDVAGNQLNTIVIDFDPSRAIVQTGASGKYIFKPTGIRIVQVTELSPDFGAISGSVECDGACSTATIEVSTDPGGVLAAKGNVADDGTFRVFLPPGDYMLKVSADGFEDLESGPHTVVGEEETILDPLVLTPTSTS